MLQGTLLITSRGLIEMSPCSPVLHNWGCYGILHLLEHAALTRLETGYKMLCFIGQFWDGNYYVHTLLF